MKNITLAVEDHVLEQVKLAAVEQRTTVNAMVQEFFATVAERRAKDEARLALLKLAREAAGDVDGKNWNREALYDR
ncbi:hypothetical protein NKJ06_29035 [Mesorhizobium sp. M0293]|uniref:hypothetical protein n=1 Tax=unclassified Mesorhizobium TaxID=325217 RepID=UPI0033377CD6